MQFTGLSSQENRLKNLGVKFPFNETFSGAAMNIWKMNLNHGKKLTYISKEFHFYYRRIAKNFWLQGSFLKIRAKIRIFSRL